MSNQDLKNGDRGNYFLESLGVVKEDIKENVKPDIRNIKEQTKKLRDDVDKLKKDIDTLSNYAKIVIGILVIAGVSGGIGGTLLTLAVNGYKENVSQVFDKKASEAIAVFEKKANDVTVDFQKKASDSAADFAGSASAIVAKSMRGYIKVVPHPHRCLNKAGIINGGQTNCTADCDPDEILVGGTCGVLPGGSGVIQNVGPDTVNNWGTKFNCTWIGQIPDVETIAICMKAR